MRLPVVVALYSQLGSSHEYGLSPLETA